jgi:hypothetical protein
MLAIPPPQEVEAPAQDQNGKVNVTLSQTQIFKKND